MTRKSRHLTMWAGPLMLAGCAALALAATSALAGCQLIGGIDDTQVNGGGNDGGNEGDGGAGDGGGRDCVAGGTQCTNCVDDDGDGLIDGFDAECSSALDNDEGSFASGVPGDNVDAVNLDCLYDGNSGAGDDGCDLHACCMLDVNGNGACPPNLNPAQYDPNQCDPGQQCIDTCAPRVPPGCDCFGCCTVCGGMGCVDVFTHPATAPDCDQDAIGDPSQCPPCVKAQACATPCDPNNCILCLGQTAGDLPANCAGSQCPNGLTACISTSDCQDGEYCAVGCCVAGAP